MKGRTACSFVKDDLLVRQNFTRIALLDALGDIGDRTVCVQPHVLAHIEKRLDAELLQKTQLAVNPQHANLIFFHPLSPLELFCTAASTGLPCVSPILD